MAKPTVFIGSSNKQYQLALLVGAALKADTSPVPWQNALELTDTIFDGLIRKTRVADFAVFVFVREDILQRPDGKRYLAVRDNVLFEFGLFLGALGRDRTFALMASNTEEDAPADLAGVLMSTFDPEDPNRSAAIAIGCAPILERISALGSRRREPSVAVFDDLNAASGTILHSLQQPTTERLAILAGPGSAVIPSVLERKLAAALHVTIHLVNPNHPLKDKLPSHWPEDSRNTLRRLAELVAGQKGKLSVDCWFYDHVPCVHGFMIDSRELFIGFYRWEDGQLVGAQAPYRRLQREAATEDFFVLFESWLSAPTARPESLPIVGLTAR